MIMGYVPPKPPSPGVFVPSAWDCEYCGTYVQMGLASRCPSCGAPFRRRLAGDRVNVGDVYGGAVLKPAFPANRIVKE
jgi:hypothetical protein